MLGVFWGIGLGTNTVETCVSFCDSKGYRIAGLQIGYDINHFVSFIYKCITNLNGKLFISQTNKPNLADIVR